MNTISEKSTVKDLLEKYKIHGFGSMNKTDIEVLFMNILLKGSLKGKSNYEISRELRIPEARVKTLIYQASLRYVKSDIELIENFIFCFLKAKDITSSSNNGKIKFIIEDIATRKYLDGQLKKQGFKSDTSFNSEIVVIESSSLTELLKHLFEVYSKEKSEEQLESTLTKLLNDIKEAKKKVKTIRIVDGVVKLFSEVLRSYSPHISQKIIDLLNKLNK